MARATQADHYAPDSFSKAEKLLAQAEDYYRRNGIMRTSDAKMTQYLFIDGDYLTWTTIAYDPAYLTEPLIRNASYRTRPSMSNGIYAYWHGRRIAHFRARLFRLA